LCYNLNAGNSLSQTIRLNLLHFKIMPVKKKNPIKPKGNKSAKQKVVKEPIESSRLDVKDSLIKRSPHLVNLKNPNQNFFNSGQTLSSAVSERSKNLVKPPRDLPRKNRNIQVDFSGKNASTSSSPFLGNLFQAASSPVKKMFNRQESAGINQVQTSANPLPLSINQEVDDVFASPKRSTTVNGSLAKKWYRSVAIFIGCAILLILPLQAYTYYQELQGTKDQILVLAGGAIDSLKSAQQAASRLDLDAASVEFEQAKNSFSLALDQVNGIRGLALKILKLIPGPGDSVEAGVNLLQAGQILAEVGQTLTAAGSNVLSNPSHDYYQSLVDLEKNFEAATVKFGQAKEKIQKVKPENLPAQYRANFNQVLAAMPTAEKGLNDLRLVAKAALKVLGHGQWQRYLIMFANNNELRGSGGFFGSFALLDVDRGKIKKMEIPAGGTYDVQGQLIPQVISPEPLHLINPRWEFQDSNWWPDYPTTAKKIQWFYENAGGPSTNGVVLMTATLMSNLLSALGPIELPEYNAVVSGDNFATETQKIIRSERDKESSQPKQIIADLGPEVLERLFSVQGDTLLKLLEILKQGLNEKQLLVYFNDSELEKIILSFDWGGKLKETDGDYLSVVHSNLAGGKTDAVITEKIEHQAEIMADGSIVDTVKLTRTHNGPNDKNPFTGVQNNSYVRFYVPGGSSLIEAKGFKKPEAKYFEATPPELKKDVDLISIETNKFYDEPSGTDVYWENGKTVFGNWLQLKPGETGEAVIKYRLPFKIKADSLNDQNNLYYSLLAQKQSGSLGSDLISVLKLNDSLKVLDQFPKDLKENNRQIIFNQKLNTDQFYSVVLAGQ